MSLVNEQQGNPGREVRESVKGGSISVKDAEIFEERTGSETAVDKEQDGISSELTHEREAKLKKAYRRVDHVVLHITNVAILNPEQGTGIKHQLGDLTGAQWAWILSAFAYPYMALEPVSTVLMKRFSPRKWMSRILLTWGTISMCQAATQNYGGLLVCRILLGFAEAGFWPGILFHLSFFYPADRTGLRIALLYISSQFAGMLSGLLAFGLAYMNGVAGLAGWRWMFLLEGAPVLLGGVATIFVLPDYPNDKAKFLSQEDRELIVSELPENQPTADSKTWDWSQVKLLACNPVFYLFILIWTSHCIGSFSVAMVLPTVFYALKLENSKITQLLTLPPYAIGILVVLIIATQISKRKVNAWKCAIILEMINCGCYVALLVVSNAVAKYVLVCFAIVCASGVIPILLPELIRTSSGTTATALTIGIVCCFAHTASIAGPQVYQDGYGPHYRLSFSVSLGLLAIAIAAMLVNWMLIRRRDVKAKAATTKAGQ
ncbi:hypothetical protein LTR97_010003 [Elasticomyces elasticus]|uniref:Major facilitator superfamily (MFS) profile domain-containing protein n=1 Tax=Elasticomyces elasticus TaxID=574655 RepID=A0AAN7W0T8_9PEZI|nr:hypothetical protein LTR97_010003 [Elasticomyces elasticus]